MSSRQRPGLDRFPVQTYPCFTLGYHLVYDAEHVLPCQDSISLSGCLLVSNHGM